MQLRDFFYIFCYSLLFRILIAEADTQQFCLLNDIGIRLNHFQFACDILQRNFYDLTVSVAYHEAVLAV